MTTVTGYPEEALEKAIEIETYIFNTANFGSILLDGEYWLEGDDPSSSIYLISPDPAKEIPFFKATFYADCIAFEHNTPTLVFPKKALNDSEVPWLTKPTKENDEPANVRYINLIREAGEVASRMSKGDFTNIVFKYDTSEGIVSDEDGVIHVELLPKYEKISKAIHLYNSALRQTDPLSQYLSYYRVLESIFGTSGRDSKAWIEETLNSELEYCLDVMSKGPRRFKAYELVPPEFADAVREDRLYGDGERVNIIEIMRASAIVQLAQLRFERSEKEIAELLYNEDRCGIAHGGNIRFHDLSDDFVQINGDLKLIKYLARLAIEAKMP